MNYLTRWQRPEMTGWSGIGRLSTLRDEIDRLFEAPLAELARTSQQLLSGWSPALDIYEEKDNFVVKAELPGVDPQNVDIEVHDSTLVLRGERRFDDPAETNVAYHRREREQGQFRRVVRLPGKVDGDQAAASYHDGVLSIRVPKAKETQPRRVAIQAA